MSGATAATGCYIMGYYIIGCIGCCIIGYMGYYIIIGCYKGDSSSLTEKSSS